MTGVGSLIYAMEMPRTTMKGRNKVMLMTAMTAFVAIVVDAAEDLNVSS